MSRRRPVLKAEPCDEMEAATLNQALVQWTWKREGRGVKCATINLFSKRVIVKQIVEELKLTGNGVYQEFLNSCFGFLVLFDTQGFCCNTALHLLFAHEVVKADAGPGELWYRVGGRFIRFSKYEYALVTGLSFGSTAFDPSAEHHPPASGLFLRHYGGRNLTMDSLRSDFTRGAFRGSPSDALKVGKLLIVYFLLFGLDGTNKYIDEWAWTLIEDTDQWETFMWGKYSYQILLTHLERVPTELPHSKIPSYRIYGFVWAFLIWAFEAIPEFGNACGVHISDNVIPRCLRWGFKNRVAKGGFHFHPMEVHPILEPSEEEQRQPYWEHIHNDLQSGVSYVHKGNTFKKNKMMTHVQPSSREVPPVSRPQRAKDTRTRGFLSTSAKPMKFLEKRKRTDPLTTHASRREEEDIQLSSRRRNPLNKERIHDEFRSSVCYVHPVKQQQKKTSINLSEQECGSRDEMASDLQKKKLSALVRGELPVLVRQELLSVIHLALRDFFLQRDHAVGGTSPSTQVTRPTDGNLSLSMDYEPELSDVAVDQAGQNKLIFELNEKIKEFKNKNLENERLVGIFQEKYKHFDTMVVEMGKEIEELRHEKSAAIRTVEKLRLKQLETDKVVVKLKRKNLEANLKKMESNNDKVDIRLENLSPKIMKIEATSEEGEILDRKFRDEKYSSGNGKISGLSKKGDRNSAQLWTRDDDAHAVETSRSSQSHDNPPQSECNVTVKDNEHREQRASGNSTTELNGSSDEASTDYSDESCTDSRTDDLIVSLWSKNLSRIWTYEADMLRAFQQDEQLCMNAVCALYRQHIVARKSKGCSKIGGFRPVDSRSGCALAEYLIDSDRELRLRKSVSEVKKERPAVISQCRKLATTYVKRLFQIYCADDDPFFGQS